ncbi:DUF3732 domain-containing protein [Paenibacillus taichungensis]|uniref:DUF3732 domain-containing protein n=1 Tax=Paenibacillus taichungensis TaxID=484184 RepID=UPI0039A48AD9
MEFKNNKVNVITGESETGKSEIISIIDYCFYASEIDITEEKINENVEWYGIKFSINNKIYTIARGRIKERRLSKEYYFSPVGIVPNIPKTNIEEIDVKKVIEKEFSISDKTVFTYGSKNIMLGSKISPRYFFMFNTQSENIIINTEVFFDKQNKDNYRDALTRIFDLAVGIESEENLLLKAKINELNKEINSLNRKKLVFDRATNVFLEDLKSLSERAQTFNLIDYEVFNVDVVLPKLKATVTSYKEENITINLDKLNKLKREKNSLIRKIKNLKSFKNEYEEYRKLEAVNLDSLKPVVAIKNAYYKLFGLPDLDLIMNVLNEEYHEIKKNIAGKPPFDFNVDEKISKYELDVDKLNMQIINIPINDAQTRNEMDKLIFIGELKAKIAIYEGSGNEAGIKSEITNDLNGKVEIRNELEKYVVDYTEQKDSVLRLLDELVQNYLEQSEDAIPTYKGYKSAFQYKEKRLKLREPKAIIPTKVGSSSNHLFLHLCLFLGLQELIVRQNSPYVPNWLILDQPSRPYFGEEEEVKAKEQKEWEDVSKTDRAKIKIAMRLLNDFITYVNNDLKKDFQIIVLEHIPKSIWQEAKLDNFFQVDEDFKYGNALIRFDINGEPY